MNVTPHNPGGSENGSFEATLHGITHITVPAGLEERVHAVLQAAPRQARVLAWTSPWSERSWTANWMRAAAAAAIVVVVAGGGWGVYTRVQQQNGKMIVVPAPVVPVGAGFSSAGAIRTPQTVQGPVLSTTEQKPDAKAVVAKERAAHHAGQETAGRAVQAVGK
ncbi:MAG: hypothetical protein ACLGPM_02130 [Acidobacteriota bacterium]